MNRENCPEKLSHPAWLSRQAPEPVRFMTIQDGLNYLSTERREKQHRRGRAIIVAIGASVDYDASLTVNL